MARVTIDEHLLAKAKKAGGHRTQKATVVEALQEYVQHRQQIRIVDLFGTIDFDPKYDYKKQRRRK
jgi:hypothetical protein